MAIFDSVSQSLVTVMTIYDSQCQSMAVNGSLLAIINDLYQPERRRREGQLHTPHDPMLAFCRIFRIPRISKSSLFEDIITMVSCHHGGATPPSVMVLLQ